MKIRNTAIMFGGCALALAAGCASFKAERTSRFINENGEALEVEYARCPERETTFIAPNGAKLSYKSKQKVRVTMPDGDDFIAYRHMSLAGVLYKTEDEEWEFFEEGAACAVAQMAEEKDGYLLRFQGILNMNEKPREKKPKISGSSTPQGFGRPSSGPRESNGPRTVEGK